MNSNDEAKGCLLERRNEDIVIEMGNKENDISEPEISNDFWSRSPEGLLSISILNNFWIKIDCFK
jgi:hypothetical protein